MRDKNAKESSRPLAALPDSSRTDSAHATIVVDGVSVAIPAVLYESELLAMAPQPQETPAITESETPPDHPRVAHAQMEEPAADALNSALHSTETAIADTASTTAADPAQQAAISAAIDPLPVPPAMEPGVQGVEPVMQAAAPGETAIQPQGDREQEFLAWLENTTPHLPPAPPSCQEKSRNHFESGTPDGSWTPDHLNTNGAPPPNEPSPGGDHPAPNPVCQTGHQPCSGAAQPETPCTVAFGTLSPSSHEMAGPPPPVNGGFRFEVNADLVIFGATEPDATVKVNGCPVSLNEDGSFSFRLAFPDGPRELSIEAVSASGEHCRKATLSFDRQTKMK